MDLFTAGLPIWAYLLSALAMMFAGFVKGAIGFAMPLIIMAILPSFMSVQMALAALILPVLVTNIHQALRQGLPEALASARRFWRILAMTAAGIAISAPFVVVLPQQIMFLLLGGAVLFFALLQMSGWTPVIAPHLRTPSELGIGLVGGLYGGISGIWGPPTIVYLLAIRLEKREMVRVLSVVFTLGGVVLALAHLRSGVLNAQTALFSASLLVPAAIGMWIGYMVQDRLDQVRFRRWTLILLALTAVNLLRRGVMG